MFQNLNSGWGGEQRLNALYNLPVEEDYEFKDQNDRNEWVQYISKMKKLYYGPQSKDMNSDMEILSTTSQTAGNRDVHHQAWLDELEREKKKWRQLRQRKLQQWKPGFFQLLFANQYLPLSFRIIIGILCCVSLGLATRIFQNSESHSISQVHGTVSQQPSTIMAICVNAIAILYIIYIAIDEFTGKPLGLRDPLDKMKLILLDLLFIIFSSANLALAFNTRFDKEWVCTGSSRDSDQYPKIAYICRKQEALSAFLFVALFMWVFTFTISIIRVVEKVSSTNARN